MPPFNWKKWYTKAGSLAKTRQRTQLRRRTHLLLESLEDRVVPTHFRYGTVDWHPGTGNTINFNLTQSWRYDFQWTSGTPVLGHTVTTGYNFEFDTTGMHFAAINLTVTSIDTAQDFFVGTQTLSYTYPSPGSYTAFFENCCRLSTLQNNHDQNFRNETLVDVGAGNSPPVSSLPPIVQVPANQNISFQIPATDPNGDPITYRLATSLEESGGTTGFVQPTGLAVSSTGLVTWHSGTLGQLFNAAVMVEDHVGTTTGAVKSKVPVDFIMKVVDTVSESPPTVSANPPGPFTPPAGQNLSFTVTATDPNALGTITNLQALNPPAGMLFTSFTQANPTSITANWTPTTAQANQTYVVTFQATDNFGLTADVSVTITPTSHTPPTVTPPSDQTATEGASKTLNLGSFSDPDGGPWLVDVNWGDMTTDSTFTVTSAGALGTLDHTYAEESSTAVTATVTVTDNSDSQSSFATFKVSVADAQLKPTAVTITPTEGAGFTGTVATFTDDNPGDNHDEMSATIDWGDSHTSPGTVTYTAGVYSVAGTNTYAEDGTMIPVTVTINDAGGNMTVAKGTANVQDAQLHATGTTITVTEGSMFTKVVATFADDNPNPDPSDMSSFITWDGMNTTPGSVDFSGGVFTVTGTFTYQEEGTYGIDIKIADLGGSFASAGSTADVGDASLMAMGTDVHATEGAPFTGQVATFTDDNTFATSADFKAFINWGDGNQSPGTVSGGGGNFTVSGSNTYAEEGSKAISVSITDDGSQSTSAGSTAFIDDAGLIAGALTLPSATEEAGFSNFTVFNFSDTDPAAQVSDYSAKVTLGDSNTVTLTSTPGPNGQIVPDGSGFDVQLSYTYAEELTNQTFGVTVTDNVQTASASVNNFSVADAQLTPGNLTPPTALEGIGFGATPVFHFTDANPLATASDFSANVTLGDGNTVTLTSTPSLNGEIVSSGNGFDVKLSYLYTEELTNQTFGVVVTDHAQTAQASTGAFSVKDAQLSIAGPFAPPMAAEGIAFNNSTVLTFNDSDPGHDLGDYKAVVTLGDGHTVTLTGTPSADGQIVVNDDDFDVQLSHKYTEELSNQTFSVTVTDAGGASVTASTNTFSVADPAVNASGASTFSAVEGATSASQVVATFSDPGGYEGDSAYSATIDWGDSSGTTSGTISNGVVSGSHKYAEEGPYTITVTVHHDNAPDAAAVTTPAKVSDAPVSSMGGFAVTGVEGVLSASQTVATFTDAGGAEAIGAYGASISWGDSSTSPGTISYSGGVFTVSGAHSYAQESAPNHPGSNPYAITVTISHEGVQAATVNSTAVIGDATPVAGAISGPGIAFPGQSVTFSAPFTDTGKLDTHTGTFGWGDSTSTTVAAVEASGSGTVTGSHVYGVTGTYTVSLTVADEDGTKATAVSYTVLVTQGAVILDAKVSGALTLSGNGSMTLPGLVQVDSNSASALTASGNAGVTAGSINVVGGVNASGHSSFNPTPHTGAAYMADPLAGLQAPLLSGTPMSVNLSGQQSLLIHSGIYSQIKVSGQASLTMAPGIYVIAGGGLSVSGGGSVSGANVFIYNAGSNYPSAGGNFGGISLSGNGVISLTPPSTTQPYSGLLIFQARDNTRALSVSGNGMAGSMGTIYAPAAMVNLSGNGTLHNTLVVNTLTITGNGGSGLTVDGAQGADATAGTLLASDLLVYVDNTSGLFTSDELARVQDAVDGLNTLLLPYSVTISMVDAADSALANFTLDIAATTVLGGAAQGVLGCETGAGHITLVSGWDWNTSADPSQIGANQFDFQTIVTHELGHALGLGHSANPGSVMYATLSPGVARRTMTTADLNIPTVADDDAAHPLLAAPCNGSGQTAAVRILATGSIVTGPVATLGHTVGQHQGLVLVEPMMTSLLVGDVQARRLDQAAGHSVVIVDQQMGTNPSGSGVTTYARAIGELATGKPEPAGAAAFDTRALQDALDRIDDRIPGWWLIPDDGGADGDAYAAAFAQAQGLDSSDGD
jgi:hypothetical protein